MTAPMRVIDHILKEPWAIRQDALENIISIAQRKNDIEAVEARLGRPLNNTRTVSIRDSVAIIPIIGPIFRYANLFTDLSGATSVQVLATDFGAALDDPQVESIILEIDSPGGMAAGISEFSDMVRASSKKVVAYASNNAASAAYWIASAAHELVLSDTAQLGSIGVISGISKDNDEDVISFISSQSPKKRLDIDKDDDRAAMQKTVDDMADVFVNKVAKFRNVSRETVLSEFGQGWVLVGEQAVTVGMADRLGSLESLIAGLSGKHVNKGALAMTEGINQSQSNQSTKPAEVLTLNSLKSSYPDIYQSAYDEGFDVGKKMECKRIQSVESASLPGHEELITSLKFDGKTSGESAALSIIQAEKENRAKGLSDFQSGAPDPVSQPAQDHLSSVSGSNSQESMTQDERIKSKWESDKNIRAEFSDDFDAYSAYENATANGQVKILKTK